MDETGEAISVEELKNEVEKSKKEDESKSISNIVTKKITKDMM